MSSLTAKRVEMRKHFDRLAWQMLQPTFKVHSSRLKSAQVSLMTMYEAISDLQCEDHEEYMVHFNSRYITVMNGLAGRLSGQTSQEGVGESSESPQIKQLATTVKSITISSVESHLELHASNSDISAGEPEARPHRRKYLAEAEWPRNKQRAVVDENQPGASRPHLSVSIPLNMDMREFLNRRHSAPTVRSEIHVVNQAEAQEEPMPAADLVIIESPFMMPSNNWPPAPMVPLQDERRFQVAPERASPVCLCCVMFRKLESHNTYECDKFILFSVDDRRRLVNRWYICEACGRYGHKNCNNGALCESQNCATRHNKVLCPFHPLADVERNQSQYTNNLESQAVMCEPNYPPYCLCCVMYRQLLDHKLWMCERFTQMEVEERRRLAIDWLLCRVCTRYGHKQCRSSVVCKRPQCGLHNVVFCEYDQLADTESNRNIHHQKRCQRLRRQ